MWGRVYSLGHMINLSKILRAKTKTCHSRSVKHHQGKKKAKIFPLQPLKPWVGDHNSLKQYACTISLIFWTIHIYLRVLSTWTNQTLKHIRLEITSMFEICSKTCMHVYIWRERRGSVITGGAIVCEKGCISKLLLTYLLGTLLVPTASTPKLQKLKSKPPTDPSL